MGRSSLRLTLVALAAAALLGLAWLTWRGPRPAEPVGPRVAPPSVEELRRGFLAHQEDYEALRDIAASLPATSVTLQGDFLAWGGEQWTEMERGRWWRPGEVWKTTDEVLATAGLDAETFGRLRSLLVGRRLLAVLKGDDAARHEPCVEYVPVGEDPTARVDRRIVWHADRDAWTAESVSVYALGVEYPVHVAETPLPSAGWFVRETSVDRPE